MPLLSRHLQPGTYFISMLLVSSLFSLEELYFPKAHTARSHVLDLTFACSKISPEEEIWWTVSIKELQAPEVEAHTMQFCPVKTIWTQQPGIWTILKRATTSHLDFWTRSPSTLPRTSWTCLRSRSHSFWVSFEATTHCLCTVEQE